MDGKKDSLVVNRFSLAFVTATFARIFSNTSQSVFTFVFKPKFLTCIE